MTAAHDLAGLAAEVHPVTVYLEGLAPGSRRTMRQSLDIIASLLVAGSDAMALPWHALRYAQTQAARTRLAARYAPGTVNKILCALRGVLTEAWRLGLMTSDELARATDLAPIRASRLLRGRALTTGELHALFRHANARDAALLALLYGCGLRRAEAVALDLVDIERDARTVRVAGKGNQERSIPLPESALERIDAWLAIRGTSPGPLFWSHDRGHRGDRLTGAGVRIALSRLAARAGVAAFSPHDLRRTYVSDLLDAGVDLATVRVLAGHASVAMTAKYDRRGDHVRVRAVTRLVLPPIPPKAEGS